MNAEVKRVEREGLTHPVRTLEYDLSQINSWRAIYGRNTRLEGDFDRDCGDQAIGHSRRSVCTKVNLTDGVDGNGESDISRMEVERLMR